MATHFQVSSNGHDRYRGFVKTNDLNSQRQHGHGDMRAGKEKEDGEKLKLPRGYGFDKSFKPIDGDGAPERPRGRPGEAGRGHSEIDGHGHGKNVDKNDFSRHKLRRPDFERRDSWNFSRGEIKSDSPHHAHGVKHGTTQISITQITVKNTGFFSGDHLDGPEAHIQFFDALRSLLKNPSEKAYKSLNDAMTKLLDPRLVPSTVGGAAQVSFSNVKGATVAKITMEVTPAPTKSLDEAREDLKNAYSTRRDGEEGIAEIRKAASDNYRRALSEKFKSEGVISHTNHAPSTPVAKSSVIVIIKNTQMGKTNLHEIKQPDFKHNLHGKMQLKGKNSFWNDFRQHHRSYVDMLKNAPQKLHTGKGSKDKEAHGIKDGHRHSGTEKAEYRHGHSNTDKAEKTGQKHSRPEAEKAGRSHRSKVKAQRVR